MSELVREREAILLTNLEQDIQVLDPAETRLVPDSSPGFADSRLYLESQLRQAVPNDERIHVAQGAAMDPVPYQFEPARQALRQPRQRILIADAVGLGKTLEAGILVSELIARGRGRRILVLAVKSMLTQFQKEFWNRFTIPLTRLDSIGIQRVLSARSLRRSPAGTSVRDVVCLDSRAPVRHAHHALGDAARRPCAQLRPVIGWLNDRMLAAFGRHEAPVLAGVPNLATDETVFVLSGSTSWRGTRRPGNT